MEVIDDGPPVLVGYWEVRGGVEGFEEWWSVRPDYDVLVCEDFILRPGVHGVNLEPIKVIEFLRQYTPVMQPPAGRKKAVSDEVLKRLGLYLAGEPLRNAREAVRHAVVWLKHNGHRGTIRKGFINIDW